MKLHRLTQAMLQLSYDSLLLAGIRQADPSLTHACDLDASAAAGPVGDGGTSHQ